MSLFFSQIETYFTKILMPLSDTSFSLSSCSLLGGVLDGEMNMEHRSFQLGMVWNWKLWMFP